MPSEAKKIVVLEDSKTLEKAISPFSLVTGSSSLHFIYNYQISEIFYNPEYLLIRISSQGSTCEYLKLKKTPDCENLNLESVANKLAVSANQYLSHQIQVKPINFPAQESSIIQKHLTSEHFPEQSEQAYFAAPAVFYSTVNEFEAGGGNKDTELLVCMDSVYV